MMTNNEGRTSTAILAAAFLVFVFLHRPAVIRPRSQNQDPHFLSQHFDLLPGFVRRAAVEDLRAERP